MTDTPDTFAGLRDIAEAALDCHQMMYCDPHDVLRLLDLAEKAGADPVREELLAALKRAHDTMKSLPDYFEEGSHENKALTVEAEAIRAAIARAEGREDSI